jgi:hypothetical protein
MYTRLSHYVQARYAKGTHRLVAASDFCGRLEVNVRYETQCVMTVLVKQKEISLEITWDVALAPDPGDAKAMVQSTCIISPVDLYMRNGAVRRR